jgi:hypothetical protein
MIRFFFLLLALPWALDNINKFGSEMHAAVGGVRHEEKETLASCEIRSETQDRTEVAERRRFM